MKGTLTLEDGCKFNGESFGFEKSVAGEVVFNTGMVGYPESLTDPSYKGQILVLTYPIAGNWGVPDPGYWESSSVQISALVIDDYSDYPSHYSSLKSLQRWLINERIPALKAVDTRALTRRLRSKGVMLGKIEFREKLAFWDPNKTNLVSLVGEGGTYSLGEGENEIVLIDCGSKRNIARSLMKRGVRVRTVPWDYDPFQNKDSFDGLVISNGPGDPLTAKATVRIVEKAFTANVPTLGICLGSQIMGLAAGAKTYKLKFGHRSQNQPCREVGTGRCFITSQNHGYALDDKKLPSGWKPWFVNLNDGTNEGIIHGKKPFLAVQFHPEASPGPTDTAWIFDMFLETVKEHSSQKPRRRSTKYAIYEK
jgi:carbamoyl-phosphate synthase small subunit